MSIQQQSCVEAMEQALEALIQIRTPLRVNTSLDAYYVCRAIASLRQALAEVEQQEPFAEAIAHGVIRWNVAYPSAGQKLYTHPPVPQGHEPKRYVTTPREPLTAEQIIRSAFGLTGTIEIARAIEAAHGIK